MSKNKTPNKSKQPTKQDRIITLLKRPKGATLAELGEASNWQEYSIRGFISGTLKKRLKLNVISSRDEKGVRRYQIQECEPKGRSAQAVSGGKSNER